MPSRKHPSQTLLDRLWRLMYAKQSFENARIACDYIEKEDIPQADPIYYPLMVAAHVLYSRPFGRSRLSGSITSQIVPRDFLSLHERTLRMRNQLIAHLDADASDFAGEPGNRVILEIVQRHLSIHTRRVLVDRTEILKIFELSSLLMTRVDKQIGRLCDRHVSLLPAIDGKYVIDLKSQSFVPYSPNAADAANGPE
jgi:hypothetical protein